ncbi:MAG: ATP-binding protein [Candidatus Acidiferrales bacterium]
MSLLNGTDLVLLLQQPESERFERKSELDPTDQEKVLTLIQIIASMVNTLGGLILIGTQGRRIPQTHFAHFDSARLDDKVNAFVEPRVSGITSSIIGEDFVLVEVMKGQGPPYVFKKDGNYQDQNGRPRLAFRRGEVRVRHSSKSEAATREDFDRMFEERQRRLYEKVRMVFDAPPDAQIKITSGADMAVRIDPDAPGAQPVYDLLTPDPFRDVQQELTGGLKAWKTSRQVLNERQILKAYEEESVINDPDTQVLILRSCWERHLPGFMWASKVEANTLIEILRSTISTDAYPAANVALKVASLLPRQSARELVRLGYESKKKSIPAECRRLEAVIRARTQKPLVLASTMGGSKKISYISGAGVKEVSVSNIDGTVFREILRTLIDRERENRTAFKIAELIYYGPTLSEIRLPSLPSSDVGDVDPSD